MLRTTAIGVAAVALLSLAALTPASADVGNCVKQPNADTCPTMGAPTPSKLSNQGAPKNIRHAHSRHAPAPSTPQKG
jgi:hypothetical protein